MKQILAIVCAGLVSATPLTVQAQSLRLDISVSGGGFLLAQNDDRRDRGRDDRREEPRRDNQPENRRDDRLNRAVAIAQSRGRVIDAGQENGAIFWVRVATDRGRVDFLVDTNSGRIIGER